MPLFLLALGAPGLFAQNDAQRQVSEALSLYRERKYEASAAASAQASQLIDGKNAALKMDNYATWQRSLIQLGRYEEAIEVALEAQKVSRYDYRTIQSLGEAYYFAGDGAKAMPYLQQYVAINPTGDYVARVYYYMGEIYLLQGLYNHADISFSAAVYHNSGAHRWWYRLGYAREMAGDSANRRNDRTTLYASARAAYQKVIELNPGSSEARQRLSGLQAKAN